MKREYKLVEKEQYGRTYCEVYEKKRGWFGKEKWKEASFFMYQPNKTGHFQSGHSRIGQTYLSNYHKSSVEKMIKLQRELDETKHFVIEGDTFTPCIYSGQYTIKIVWINLNHVYRDRFNTSYFPYNTIEDIKREYNRKKEKTTNITYT